MTKILLIYGCLMLINALASCAGAQEELNGKWKLSGYKFSSDQEFSIEKMTVDLTITDGKRVGGNSGCNLYGGDITLLPEGKVKVGPLTATERFCDETSGQFESLFTETLQNASVYSMKDGVLTFAVGKTKNFLRFERAAKPVEPTPAAEIHETFFVGNKRVDCGNGHKCLQIKKERSGVWYELHGTIIGFEPRPGRFYKIEVRQTVPEAPPGKPRVQRYELVRVLKTVRREKDLY